MTRQITKQPSGTGTGNGFRAYDAATDLLRPAARDYMKERRIDAWFTFHIPGQTSNPAALRLLRATEIKNMTAPVMAFVYADPERKPVVIASQLEQHHYDYFEKHGNVVVFHPNRRAEFERAIRKASADCKVIATEYTPGVISLGTSIIPASLLDLLKRLTGAKIVSSGNLMQTQIAVLTPEGLASHERTAEQITGFVKEMFAFIGKNVHRITEYDAQQFLTDKITSAGLVIGEDELVVAVNENAANPHYAPEKDGKNLKMIHASDLILVDFWAKEKGPEAIYADLGWMAYVGARLPENYAWAFKTLLAARDGALNEMIELYNQDLPIQPWMVDQVARSIITRHGDYPDYPHNTGHSITTVMHGEGVLVGRKETFRGRDSRLILPGMLQSDEPGIYVTGDFGMRVEADIFYDPKTGPRVTSEIQKQMVFI